MSTNAMQIIAIDNEKLANAAECPKISWTLDNSVENIGECLKSICQKFVVIRSCLHKIPSHSQ